MLYTKHENCWTNSRHEILTIHEGRQQLSFLFIANGAKQGHHLMTSGMNHSGSKIVDELIKKSQMW